MAEREYLEGKTKETISGYHLLPRALVPRTEVTPMPGVKGGGRGGERGVRAGLFMCAGEMGFKTRRRKVQVSHLGFCPVRGVVCRDTLNLVGMSGEGLAPSSLPLLRQFRSRLSRQVLWFSCSAEQWKKV